MFDELANWEQVEIDSRMAAYSTHLNNKCEKERIRYENIKSNPALKQIVREQWNARDKKRRKNDPAYAEMRRRTTRERMRRLRAKRKLEKKT